MRPVVGAWTGNDLSLFIVIRQSSQEEHGGAKSALHAFPIV
jgi:hypothetical protein